MLEEVKYYFYTINFKPFANKANSHSSRAILMETVKHLSNIKSQGKAILVDRYEHKQTSQRRELFLSSATMIPKDRRIRCTMALIRKGKKPKLKKKGTFNLQDLGNLGDLVEVTHLFIDFSNDTGVICMEQNSHGPTIADIDYYLKYISRDELQLARSMDITAHMNNNISNTLENLKNVLSFNIKIRPDNLELLNAELGNHYLKSFDVVSSIFKPQYIKIEAFFKKNGRFVKNRSHNKMATNMFTKALEVFRDYPEETDLFDNFQVTYEDGKGLEDHFNLLKDKKVIVKKIENLEELSLKESYNMISTDIENFVKSLP